MQIFILGLSSLASCLEAACLSAGKSRSGSAYARLTGGKTKKEDSSIATEIVTFLLQRDKRDGMRLIMEAGQTKNGKAANIPVPSALAEVLKSWLAKKEKGQRLWPGTWFRDAADMLRRDLSEAKITYQTKDGFLDFHAARHTAITRGSRVMR